MRGDQRQGSLFAEPPIVLAGVLPEMWQADPETLYALIEERDGVPGILASKFAEWSPYGHAKSFLLHVERLKSDLEELGSLHQIDSMIRVGKGARRWVTDYWLNRDQLNHALIHTRLPQLRALRTLVTTVFGKYQSGKLRPVDAETEVELQEAADRVIDATPRVIEIGAELARREDAIRAAEAAERAEQASVRTLKAFLDGAAKKPKPPTKEATDCSEYIVRHKFRDLCPCCQDTEIRKDGKLSDNANWDHWENKVWRRGPYDGWYVCRDCNVRFENNDEAFRADSYNAWLNYLKHVRWYFRLNTKLDL